MCLSNQEGFSVPSPSWAGIFEYKKKIMKKILLNLLLFLCVVGYSGTVMAQHKIELDIVDRSRINEGRMKVMLEMGGLRMQGILENTNTPTVSPWVW